MKKLPIYDFVIDDTIESGVKAISIVTDPAFQSSAIFFDKDKLKFIAFEDVKKQIIAGLSLIPDVLIYRVDEEIGEYYGKFSSETIEKIVEKYHQELNSNKVNLNHDEDSFIDAFMVEDFIVNTDARVEDLKLKGIEHPNIMGSWFTSFKIKDKEVFQSIIDSGTGTGFSVESFLDRILTNFNSQIKNNYINNKIKIEMKKNTKSIKDKILAIFNSENLERVLVPELAFEIEWSEVGMPVSKILVDSEGVETTELLGQGEFVTELGIVVTDESSNLVEVRDLPEAPEEEEVVVVVETPEVVPTEEEVLPVTGSTENMSRVNFITDMDKKLKDLIPTDKAGDYTITVTVNDRGEYSWGSVSAWTVLKLSAETATARVAELESENSILLAKIAEPITEPILEPAKPVKEFNKMSAYEKLMHNKGLSAV